MSPRQAQSWMASATLVALFALLPAIASASVPRPGAAAIPLAVEALATPPLERSLAGEAGSPSALDGVSLAPRRREAGFRVFAGDELGTARILIDDLIDEPRYPETRVGGLGLPGEARVGAERSLRLEAPWACEERSSGRATGSGEFRIFDATNSPRTVSSFGWNRLFQGREHLGFVDAYDFRARVLWPEIGRFGQEDPLGTIDSLNLYQALGAAWSNVTDPMGLEIQYANHSVALGFYHSKLIVIPDNQALWKDHPYFVNNVLSDGRHYTTIGAGPEENFKGGAQRKRDLAEPSSDRRRLALPSRYRDEDEAILTLLRMINRFNSRRHYYALFPIEGGTAYNSNGFISGILGAAGYAAPDPANMMNTVPGYLNPVPPESFQ